MRVRPEEAAGLAEVAFVLGRDLQRAARTAGGPGALWRAGGAGLAEALRLSGAAAAEARAARDAVDGARALRTVRDAGLEVIPMGDDRYPARLAEVFDPPFALIAQGWANVAAALAERPVVAVVGARRATPPARRFARGLAADLAGRGAVVVSGLALGIDAEAHAGALEAGGLTVAVLGCGAAAGYPRANAALRRRMGAEGAVCGEYWPSTPPAPWRFPARNRIVSGLSHAVVVVEAAGRSGALITADFALEQGRPVLAVPGWPWSEAAAGCNELIRAGAAVCTSAGDVVAEVPHGGWSAPGPGAPGGPVLEGLPRDVHDLLRGAPLRADEIAAALTADAAAVAAALAFLELEGLALRGDGQRWWAAPTRG
ncbi:MAG: DNA-protecting protein DprA [Thermoleophilia bacterium]|nr:DNA-protecting protein DprA [Thermoleophilia bacterium]